MRRFCFVYLVLFLVSVSAASARATTVQTVTIGSGHMLIVGTLTLPAGDPAPVVLMLHGFAGARDELRTSYVEEGVFARTSNRLAVAGYASLRIDFRGSGESVADLTFSQTTFEGQILDARAAIEYLKASQQVQGDKINLLGWDQGGLVASAVAGRTGLPNSVALWAAIVDTVDTFAEILGEEALVDGTQAEADQPVKATLP